MNELQINGSIPSPSLDQLPAEERIRIIKMDSAFRVVLASGNVYKALALASAQLGISADTLKRKYYTWIKSGNNIMSLADGRIKTGERASTARTHDPAFLAHWHGLYLACQRNAGAARYLLCKQWKNKEIIPGYEGWPGWPAIPAGWSKTNLAKLAPKELDRVLMRQGVRAAAPLLPQVFATRVEGWAGGVILLDDVWLDILVTDSGAQGIPLQLGALDYYTGKRLCWGQKLRCKDEESGKNIQLRDSDMRLMLALWGATIGYSRRGTTLVAENGTAAISKDVEDILTRASNGLIKVDRSGITGRKQALTRGHGGRGFGNPRHKAALESWHNLLHNYMCHLLAPRGHNRTEPEWLAGLVAEEKALLKKAEDLPRERQNMLRHYMLTMRQLCDELIKIVQDINNRTDHHLEGWEACGFRVTEARLSERSADWTAMDDMDPRMAEMIVRLAHDTGDDLIRHRNMSPSEAWDYSVSQPGNDLVPLPLWAICDILGKDMARTVKIKGSYIRFRDKSISSEELIYESKICRPDGLLYELPDGAYSVFVNPFDSKHLFVCDAQYRCMGVASLVQRVSHNDPHAIEQAMGKVAARRAEQMERVRVVEAPLEASIIAQREHNRRVVEGEPVTIAEHLRLADMTPSPSDKAAATRRRNAATRQDMDDVMPAPVFAPSPDSSGTINLSDLY